jgi:hypothetical protein
MEFEVKRMSGEEDMGQKVREGVGLYIHFFFGSDFGVRRCLNVGCAELLPMTTYFMWPSLNVIEPRSAVTIPKP